MLSRIGESLYWMARHLERADNTARILDINVVHMLEANEGVTEEAMWMPLLQIVDADQLYADLGFHPAPQRIDAGSNIARLRYQATRADPWYAPDRSYSVNDALGLECLQLRPGEFRSST